MGMGKGRKMDMKGRMNRMQTHMDKAKPYVRKIKEEEAKQQRSRQAEGVGSTMKA